MADISNEILPYPVFESTLDHTIHNWSKKMECKSLKSCDFREYWAKNVPSMYSPPMECDCLNIEFDEKAAFNILFKPLEIFICGTKETNEVFEHIRTVSNVPNLCGKVFKSGEPTYSCRDCGLDLTCVLCVDCFKHSDHRNHRYKMSTSGGGGYCDCGDVEAWKKEPFCGLHSRNQTESDVPISALDRLPSDLVERTRLLMEVIAIYCHQMLIWDQPASLPADLQNPDRSGQNQPDTYATVLFNDETHTYEQVIETLGKATGCSKKAAIDYATMIDREGRSVVKCSTFALCNNIRHMIERITTRHVSVSLKVLVMHTDVFSHQMFALKLLSWLQKIVTYNEGFRLIFKQVMMDTRDPNPESVFSLLEVVMLSDTLLWKCARNQWHQLFISGMLMDQHCKKAFAKTFTNIYPTLLQEFMQDDHDHAISITSLSVQIFTVPTLAQCLIREDDAIRSIMQTFLLECEHNKNEEGRLAFQRNHMHNTFRRAHYMLYDLKYLLAALPALWCDQLRVNFLHGVQSYLKLLALMQGMDSVVRQVGQHIEYEAEWENGVNLQLKVSSVSTMMLQWCSTDSSVFTRAFRMTLKHLQNTVGKPASTLITICNQSVFCIEYDVSSMPVTIHLPLSRFTTGFFLHLQKFGLDYDGPAFNLENLEKPTPKLLMEFPLRTLVMLSQFRAGMWRRNGYSLLNQVYFYHNVRFREEMYDRDITMLQVCASKMDSSEFLVHVIYKFGLARWSDEKYDGKTRKSEDDNLRQVLTVAEEFLALILTIVSERHIPGVGKVTDMDRLKKEVIQLLCIESMPHSQIFKMLPREANYENILDEVVNDIAVFKKPSGPGTGKYELKPECLASFNPFFYHYSREDQSKAEETQLKRRKQTNEDLCCPPPVPPEFQPPFSPILKILECDVMLYIIRLIFDRTLNLYYSVFTEVQFEKTLHLIGVALHEEQRFLNGEIETPMSFTIKASQKGIPPLMEECLKSPRIESQKDLLRWVITKFKSVENQRLRKEGSEDQAIDTTEEDMGESSSQSRKNKADIAAARQARIMAHMKAMQKNFIKEHADLFKETLVEDSPNLLRTQSDMNIEFCVDDPISIGPKQRGKVIMPKLYTCILCREDQELTSSGRALVFAAFIQKSSVLSKNRKHYLTDPQNYDPMLLPSDLFCAPHASTCGHVMHGSCWQKFVDSVVLKEQRRPQRFNRQTSFDVDKNEYLCPLCERLSNTIIPIVPPLTTLVPERDFSALDVGIDDWLSAMKKVVQNPQVIKSKNLPPDEDKQKQLAVHYIAQPLDEVTKGMAPQVAEQFKMLFSSFHSASAEGKGDQFSPSLIDMMRVFAQATYTVGLRSNPDFSDVRVPSMSWWSCAYTIHSIERLLREQKKPLFGKLSSRNSQCLEAVVRFAGSSLRIFDHCVVRTQSMRLLRYLLLGEHHSSSPSCCLDMDAFALLVYLVLAMPVLFKGSEGVHYLLQPMGTTLDCHIVHLLLVYHIVQLLLSYPSEGESMETDTIDDLADGSDDFVAAHFYYDLRTAAGVEDKKVLLSGFDVVQTIKTGTLPFLRCAALFFHMLSDTASPLLLQENNDVEFEHICNYLGLPMTVRELLSSPSLKQLALSWVRHPRILHLLLMPSGATSDEKQQPQQGVLVRHPMSVNHLIALPNDYSELINNVSLFMCPNTVKDDSRNPTMCLVCGAILCSQSYCCQTELNGTMFGACSYHAYFCGAGVGIFLRIRDCKVLLICDKNKGSFMAPPYVDDYGETDQGLIRGNPLHLCQSKYEELNELWLSHNIPEHVSHTMEQTTNVPNWHLH